MQSSSNAATCDLNETDFSPNESRLSKSNKFYNSSVERSDDQNYSIDDSTAPDLSTDCVIFELQTESNQNHVKGNSSKLEKKNGSVPNNKATKSTATDSRTKSGLKLTSG